MKRIVLAASAALLLAGASGAAIAQDRAPAPVAAPAVWHGQGNTALDTTKVDWRDHRGRDWRRDDWRRHEWRRDNWRHDNWRRDRWGWQRHDWRWRNGYRQYDRRWW